MKAQMVKALSDTLLSPHIPAAERCPHGGGDKVLPTPTLQLDPAPSPCSIQSLQLQGNCHTKKSPFGVPERDPTRTEG